MKREEIEQTVLRILEEEFEIVDPDKDANLGEQFEFDSIDALEMLSQVEQIFGAMTMDEKKQLFDYRTINQICDYLTTVFNAKSPVQSGA